MTTYIYNEDTAPALDIDALLADVHRVTGIRPQLRDEFVSYWIERRPVDLAAMASAFVRARVADPLTHAPPDNEPMYAEISAEKRVLGEPGRTSKGILYDGVVIQYLMAGLIDPSEIDACHIIVTGRLVGTFMREDGRWHAHTGIYGGPNLISTAGLVQAPARPKAYYQGQGLATTRMVPREVVEARLREEFRGQMLLDDDPRMTPVAVGHVLQALAYHHVGEAFCEDACCPLFNARRQTDLLHAHCSEDSRLCPDHAALFDSLNRGAQ